MKIIRNLNAFCHELKSTPDITDSQAAADDIVRIVAWLAGERHFRLMVDFIDDGEIGVIEAAERVGEEFALSFGIANLRSNFSRLHMTPLSDEVRRS
jgi:hypothetical protein